MSELKAPIVDVITSAGLPPEGVDLATYVIAHVPPKELNVAIRDSSFSYEQLMQLKQEKPGAYEHIMVMPNPENALAQDIGVRQQELSAMRRRAAVALTSLSVFIGGTAYGYNTLTELDKDMKIPTTTIDRLERGAILGGPAGALGGFVTYFTALSLSGRLARRPAQRIVQKAQDKTFRASK